MNPHSQPARAPALWGVHEEETTMKAERQAILLAMLTAVGSCAMFYEKPKETGMG